MKNISRQKVDASQGVDDVREFYDPLPYPAPVLLADTPHYARLLKEFTGLELILHMLGSQQDFFHCALSVNSPEEIILLGTYLQPQVGKGVGGVDENCRGTLGHTTIVNGHTPGNAERQRSSAIGHRQTELAYFDLSNTGSPKLSPNN